MTDIGTTEDAWGNEVDEPREVTFRALTPAERDELCFENGANAERERIERIIENLRNGVHPNTDPSSALQYALTQIREADHA